MKRFLTSGVLVSAMLTGFLILLSPASLVFATTTGERSQSVAPIAFGTSICAQWIDETGCNTGAPRPSGTNIFITVSARPAPVAPWHLVMMTKEMAPSQGAARVQADCGQRAQCQVAGPASGPGTAIFWSCVTDATKDIPDVCSKAGPHAILSDYSRVVVS